MEPTSFAFIGSTKSGKRAGVEERDFTDSVNVRHHFLLYHKLTEGSPAQTRLARKSLKPPSCFRYEAKINQRQGFGYTSKAVPVAAIKNFRRMIQSIRKSCFGSIVKGSSNFWIGSIANGIRRKLYLQTCRAEGFA